jgi:hypothetical protein
MTKQYVTWRNLAFCVFTSVRFLTSAVRAAATISSSHAVGPWSESAQIGVFYENVCNNLPIDGLAIFESANNNFCTVSTAQSLSAEQNTWNHKRSNRDTD